MNVPLRTDLLAGQTVLAAEAPAGREGLRPGLAAALSERGAAITVFAPRLDEAGDGGAAWVAEHAPSAAALVFDGRGARDTQAPGPRPGDSAGIDPLRELLDAAWIAVAAAANGAFLPSGRGGRVVFVAPARDSAWWTPAAAAGLENLARTLSVEWARHAITTTAVVPARATDPDVLAGVVAFLLSPAGAYHSGSRLDLDGLNQPPPSREAQSGSATA